MRSTDAILRAVTGGHDLFIVTQKRESILSLGDIIISLEPWRSIFLNIYIFLNKPSLAEEEFDVVFLVLDTRASGLMSSGCLLDWLRGPDAIIPCAHQCYD